MHKLRNDPAPASGFTASSARYVLAKEGCQFRRNSWTASIAPKYHHPPISGGDHKALTKEIAKARVMTGIFAERSADKRREGEALIREADNLACQSWNERMWSDGGPIDPSPTVDQAINGG